MDHAHIVAALQHAVDAAKHVLYLVQKSKDSNSQDIQAATRKLQIAEENLLNAGIHPNAAH